MANRYQPPKSMTALEVLRHGKAMYPDSEIGDEMGVSPEVYLRGTQDRLDAYAGGIESKRKFAVGAGKAAWELHKHGDLAKIKSAVGSKIATPTNIARGKNFVTGLKIGAKNVAAGTPMAGAGTASTAASTATSIGAAVPPLLAAVAISKLIGSSKMGKQWTKSTNKHLKGRFKNLLSPWKWRL